MSTPAPLSKPQQNVMRTLEVERAVLGGVLMDPDLLAEAQEHITPADFYRLAHRLVFDALIRLSQSNKPIDILSVVNVLTAAELQEAGGPAFIGSLTDGVPRALNVGHYASLVKEFSTLRGLERAARRILSAAESGDTDATEILADAEREIFTLRDRATKVDVLTPRRRASDTFHQIEVITSSDGALRGVTTGLRDLDADLRGLHAGNLIVLGARPSQGKSALALTVAINAAAATAQPALFFSLEMSADELNLREVTMRANVDAWRLTHGRVSEVEQHRLAVAIEDMQDGGVHLVDAPVLTVGQIRALARRAKISHGLSVVIVDYVQLITPESTKGRSQENRTIELGAISRDLKGIARELNTPVLLLSQLSRIVESRSDKRPQLSDLRESGSLEQDADVVLLLYRPNAYDDLRKSNKFSDDYSECLIAKQRNGPIGPVKLRFLRHYTKFVDYAEEITPEAQQLGLGPVVA